MDEKTMFEQIMPERPKRESTLSQQRSRNSMIRRDALGKLGLAAVVVAVLGLFTAAHAGETIYADRVVAVVNRDVILESEVKRQKSPFVRTSFHLPLGVLPPGKWPTEKEILDELVVIHLLGQEAMKKGMDVTDDKVDHSIDLLKKRNNLNDERLMMFLLKNGISYSDYRNLVKRHMIVSSLLNREVYGKIPMSEEDGQLYFKKHRNEIEEQHRKLKETLMPAAPPEEEKEIEIPTHKELYMGGQVRLRQIVLKPPPAGDKKAEQKAVETLKKVFEDLQTGADFADVAKKHSQDPSAARGGDLGMLSQKDLNPTVQKVVETLRDGSFSNPMRSSQGYVILYVAESKNRQLKKVPIPEKERQAMIKQLAKLKEQQAAQRKQAEQRRSPSQKEPAEDMVDEPSKASPDNKEQSGKNSVLTPEEEKEYKQVRGKVIDIVRFDKIKSRMDAWINDLKKNSNIEIRL